MKCPSCGAEIENGNKFCKFCGTPITAEMQREQEQLNKEGCPKCGSTNVTFTREKQGEIRNKKGSSKVVLKTVGVCHDCGHTWTIENAETVKKRKTALWVLGWIFIFPVSLTILMLRPTCKLEKKVRYGIIAVAWVVYILWMAFGGRRNPYRAADNRNNTAVVVAETTARTEEANSKAETAKAETTKAETTKTETTKKETTKAATTETAKTETTKVDATKEESAAAENSSAVTPELKEFLDSYEAFIDEYCEFIQAYDATDMSMLLKYTEFAVKAQEFADKANAYESEELSVADSSYYLEVLARVNEKLAKAAYK